MDFDKLDKIIGEFIKNRENRAYIDGLSQVIPLCEQIINRKDFLPVKEKEFSTDYGLNKKIELVSSFLGTLDFSLKDQFDNLIKSVEENGSPTISFISKDGSSNTSYGSKKWSYAIDGKAFVVLNNGLDDMFSILHEAFHVMNHYEIVDENNKYLGENYTRKFYGEAVSITAEKLFGEYLVQNNYITANDYNILMNKRLTSSKTDAQAIIVESILIDMKQSGIKIDFENIKKYLDGIELSDAKKEAVSSEFKTGNNIRDILYFNEMQFPFRQRYIIAQALMDKLSIEELIKLNHEVGNPDASLSEITSSVKK